MPIAVGDDSDYIACKQTYATSRYANSHVIEGIVRTGLADDAVEGQVGHDTHKKSGEQRALYFVVKGNLSFGRVHRRKERHQRPNSLEKCHVGLSLG